MATKMTTMTSALENLPSELLEYICSFLSPEDINKLHLVSTSLDNFVVCTFWRRFIHHQCSVDCKLKSLLETQMNWSANSEDYNLISKVYKKIKDEKRWLKESVYSSALMFEFPSDAGFSVRVSSCALYKDKVFVSFVGGNVQCRSCLDFSQIKVLHTAPLNHNSSEPASLITPMSISTNVLAVSIGNLLFLSAKNYLNQKLFYFSCSPRVKSLPMGCGNPRTAYFFCSSTRSQPNI